jgi:hypothetical protein
LTLAPDLLQFSQFTTTEPMTVTLTPISAKAKNRLANQMAGDPVVVVEQRDGNDLFCVSSNGTWCAWVNCLTDPNWAVHF